MPRLDPDERARAPDPDDPRVLGPKGLEPGARAGADLARVALQPLPRGAVPRALFAAILRRIDRLRGPPVVAA